MNIATQIEVFSSLIRINHDRIKGYRSAIRNLKDSDSELKFLFKSMILQSIRNNAVLRDELQKLGGTVINGSSIFGKVYCTCMGLTAAVTGASRYVTLNSCKLGEIVAMHAYRKAVACEALTTVQLSILRQQQYEQLKSLRKVKNMNARLHEFEAA